MTRCRTNILMLLAAVALLAAPPAPGANLPAATGYQITDLPGLGGSQTVPIALNARGDVVGYSTNADGQARAFLLPANGTIQDLGPMGGTASYAIGLNNRGDIVGYAVNNGQFQPFALFDGQVIDLGLDRTQSIQAVAINDRRQVLLIQDPTGASPRSLLWQNGQTTPLSLVVGGSAFASGLSHLGEVVGNSRAEDGTNHAFAYDTATRGLLDMGDIGMGGTMARVNELGQAAGVRITAAGAPIAFAADLRKESGFLTDLTIRRGFSGTQALGINNQNTIAGAGVLPAAPFSHAGVWTADGQFTNLNAMALAANSGWTLLTANAINDAGVVVGRALSPDGQPVAFRLAHLAAALPSERAATMAAKLDEAIGLLVSEIGADANAPPSPLETALANLRQARVHLTLPEGQTAVDEANSGQAFHLLLSAVNLLSAPSDRPVRTPADLERARGLLDEVRSDFS